ncbi:ABC transporter permease [Microbacterium gilvum]|uniref:ABC transporter permease n=1 Tax=Microbacterium gilvum TaxID=1336204 RepID=A0ABP9AQW3_9MICO
MLRFVLPVTITVVFLIVWELGCRLSGIKEFLLPAPSAIAEATVENWQLIVAAIGRTLGATIVAFVASAVVGNVLAIVLATSRVLERSTYGFIVLVQTIPMVAIAPFIIIWFGPTFTSVVVVATLSAFFPILANSLQGLRSADRGLRELFVLYEASKLDTLLRLRLPAALPQIMTGLRLGGVLAVIGVISGEFITGTGSLNPGIGFLILRSGVRLETALLFAAGLASALLGIAFNAAIKALSARLLRSWHVSEMA